MAVCSLVEQARPLALVQPLAVLVGALGAWWRVRQALAGGAAAEQQQQVGEEAHRE